MTEPTNPETGAEGVVGATKFFLITVGVLYLGKIMKIGPAVRAWEEGLYSPIALGPTEVSFGPLPLAVPGVGSVNVPLGRFVMGALFTGAWYVLGGAEPLGNRDEISRTDVQKAFAEANAKTLSNFVGRAIVMIGSKSRRIQVYMTPAWIVDP